MLQLTALDVVSEQPVVDVAYISQALGISDRRAADAIDALVSIDALRQIGSGQRNRRWQAPEILALDQFAERVARR